MYNPLSANRLTIQLHGSVMFSSAYTDFSQPFCRKLMKSEHKRIKLMEKRRISTDNEWNNWIIGCSNWEAKEKNRKAD